jgi:hypothetical protein
MVEKPEGHGTHARCLRSPGLYVFIGLQAIEQTVQQRTSTNQQQPCARFEKAKTVMVARCALIMRHAYHPDMVRCS